MQCAECVSVKLPESELTTGDDACAHVVDGNSKCLFISFDNLKVTSTM